MRILVSALIALWLTGCSSMPVPIAEANPVTAEYIYAPEYLQPSDDRTEKVVVVRDDAFEASKAGFVLILDGTPVAELYPSDKVELYLGMGLHLGQIKMNTPIDIYAPSDVEILVTDKLPNNFRMRPVYNDSPRLDRSSAL